MPSRAISLSLGIMIVLELGADEVSPPAWQTTNDITGPILGHKNFVRMFVIPRAKPQLIGSADGVVRTHSSWPPVLIPRGWRYADHIVYHTPDSLSQLRGPTSGVVRVPPKINTAPDPSYGFDVPSSLWARYIAIARDAYPGEHAQLLERETLIRLWPDLNLPKRGMRQIHERTVMPTTCPQQTGSVAPNGATEPVCWVGGLLVDPDVIHEHPLGQDG